jgi:transposase
MDREKLTSTERRKLTKVLRQTRDVRQYRRALAILETNKGRTVSEIAQELQVSRQSVYNWVSAYWHTRDVRELTDAPHPGRPPRWFEEAGTLLESLLQSSPQDFGYFATQWTVPLLREQLSHSIGYTCSTLTVRRGLHRLGYMWKRPRYVLVPDPEREKKTPNSPRHQWLAKAQRVVGRR